MKWEGLFPSHNRLLEMALLKRQMDSRFQSISVMDICPLFDGVELYTVSKEGSEVLLATYDVILGQFLKVNP